MSEAPERDIPEGYRSHGPRIESILPLTHWYPAWWGISPWASSFWTTYQAPTKKPRPVEQPGRGE